VALRFLSVPIVVVVLVLGVWITGGLITNDFTLAMWLTAAWMGLAGAACLALAVRNRALRVPILGAYLVTALVLGGYLGRSMFFDDEVNENVVTAAAPAPQQETPAPRRNTLAAEGTFESLAHSASGSARVIERPGGKRYLTLTDFEVDNGPDLRVYLVAGDAREESDVDDFEDLGGLKGNKGNQQYEIPRGLDIRRYRTAMVWCRAFSVAFARAPLRGAL
jgi:hypothetical protein